LTRLIAWLLTMLYTWILKPLYKLVVDFATGKSELERIVDRASVVSPTSSRVRNICQALIDFENMLQDSSDPKCLEMLACRDHGRVADYSRLLIPSRLNPSLKSSDVEETVSTLLSYLFSYNALAHELDCLRQTPFDSENADHEAELAKLWADLKPDQELSARICADWGDIGFQGDDPKTDFRGMGMLGLRNIAFFAGDASFGPSARRTLSRSHHPQFWYSWAIVGINLTSLCLEFLKRGLLKESIYAAAIASSASSSTLDSPVSVNSSSASSSSSSTASSPCLPSHFHAIFCRVFIAFDEFWIQREKSVMEFNSVREEFRLAFLRQLRAGNLANEALENLDDE